MKSYHACFLVAKNHERKTLAMLRAIGATMRQALNPAFLLGVACTILIIFLSSIESIIAAFRSTALIQYGFHHTVIMSSLSSDAMALALPILCALPYTASVIDDIKSGFIKAYLHRTTVSRYIISKALASAVSGGLVLAAGILSANLIAALMF